LPVDPGFTVSLRHCHRIPAEGELCADHRAHADAGDDVDGNARLAEGAEDADMRKGPGAAAAEDKTHRTSGEETPDTADVVVRLETDVMMRVDVAVLEPSLRPFDPREIRSVEQDQIAVRQVLPARQQLPLDVAAGRIARGVGDHQYPVRSRQACLGPGGHPG